MKSNQFTFQKGLLVLALVLTLGCVFGWAQLSKGIASFEESMTREESSGDIELLTPPETAPEEPQGAPEEGEEVKILLPPEEELQFKSLTQEVAESYARFTSGELSYNRISGYFQEGSEMLELLSSYNSKRYNDYESSHFEHTEVETPYVNPEGRVVCRVSFDYVVITKEDTHTFPSTYTLYFNRESQKVVSFAMGGSG